MRSLIFSPGETTLGTSWSSTQVASGRPVCVHSLLGLGLQGCRSSGCGKREKEREEVRGGWVGFVFIRCWGCGVAGLQELGLYLYRKRGERSVEVE